MLYLAAILGGALGNRLRGGLWGVYLRLIPFAGRTAWAAICGGLTWWAGLPVGYAVAFAAAAWVGCVPGQFGGLAMGQRGERPPVDPWHSMRWWGLDRVLLPCVVLSAAGCPLWPLLLLAGAVCPAIYRAVWMVPGRMLPPGLGRGNGAAEGYDPPELAEAVHGAVMALAAVVVVLAR